MNYLEICLEYLRSVECNFSPLGVLSRGTQAYPYIFVFCFANRRLLFIFLGVHVSVLAFFAQETFINIATEDVNIVRFTKRSFKSRQRYLFWIKVISLKRKKVPLLVRKRCS